FPSQRSHQPAKLPVRVARVPVIDEADDEQIVLRNQVLLEATNRIFVRELLRRGGSIPVSSGSALASAIKRSLSAEDCVPSGRDCASQDFHSRRIGGDDPGNDCFRISDIDSVRETVWTLALPRNTNVLLNSLHQFLAGQHSLYVLHRRTHR